MPSDLDCIDLFLDEECTADEERRLRRRISRDKGFQREFSSACRLHYAALKSENPEAAEDFRLRLADFIDRRSPATRDHQPTERDVLTMAIPFVGALAASFVVVVGLAVWKFGISDVAESPLMDPVHLTSVEEMKESNPGMPLSVALQVNSLSLSDIRSEQSPSLLASSPEEATARLLEEESFLAPEQSTGITLDSLGTFPSTVPVGFDSESSQNSGFSEDFELVLFDE